MGEGGEVRRELRKQRGPDDDTIVFRCGPLEFGINVSSLTAASAEAYLDLQQREVIGIVTEKGNPTGIFFAGGAPNVLRFTSQGELQLSYTGEDLEMPSYTDEAWLSLAQEVESLLDRMGTGS